VDEDVVILAVRGLDHIAQIRHAPTLRRGATPAGHNLKLVTVERAAGVPPTPRTAEGQRQVDPGSPQCQLMFESVSQ
jgi:hypothetical protein